MMEFNSMPIEVHLEIFSHLPVYEIKEIRRVCKQWNHLINCEFRFKQLSCYQSNHLSVCNFNFRSIRSFLDCTNAHAKFSRVKHLDAGLYPNYADLENAFDFLNWFRSVEELSFTYSLYALRRMDRAEIQKKAFVLSLAHLKKAKIWLYWQDVESKFSVLLDLPSLLYLQIRSWKGVTLKHTEKLRILKVNRLFNEGPDYSKFISLSNIYTGGEDLRSISARFIKNLPSLRELHLDYNSYYHSDRRSVAASSKATARIFYYLFEFTLNQINSEDQQFPSSFYRPDEATTEFIVGNLHQSLDNNSFVTSINYNSMARALDDTEMFIVVPQKFPWISHIRIHGAVADVNRLLKFIKHIPIRSLKFEGTPLPQRFFEKLAVNGSSIQSLWFHTQPTMDILTGDFDFVFKLNNIKYFSIDGCSLPLNFVVRLLRDLKGIEGVSFYQPRIYEFRLSQWEDKWEIELKVYNENNEDNEDGENEENEEDEDDRVGYLPFWYRFSAEKLLEMMATIARTQKADGFMCPRKLSVLLGVHKLKLEEETNRFMMRKYIYDHTHSICLSEEQMRLFNFGR